jgi:hypothetical protein
MNDSSELFLVSWDCTGLETCINITEYEKAEMWAKLSDTEPPVGIGKAMQHLMLRARANPQRHYEIYTFNVATGITKEDIREMFNNTPQAAADLIRDRGRKIYSDRVGQLEVKIV